MYTEKRNRLEQRCLTKFLIEKNKQPLRTKVNAHAQIYKKESYCCDGFGVVREKIIIREYRKLKKICVRGEFFVSIIF
jgi:hypothetical protein